MHSRPRPITTSPSIVVIQGAYDQFCAPASSQESLCYAATAAAYICDVEQTAIVVDELIRDFLTFQRLVSEWHVQRGATSSITQAALCPAYQSIIGMGWSAVPYLLDQLDAEGDEPDQWFWALKAITGEDPIRDEDRGDFTAMARSWRQWAERRRAW